MEEILNCSICAQQFNSNQFIPKILECGHTFCSPCLIKLFRNSPSCPNCRVIIKGSERSLPVNYFALEIVDSYEAKSWSEKEIDTMNEVSKRKDIILKKKTRMTSSLEVLDKCLEKLEELTSRSKRVDTANVKKILNEVDEDLKKTIDVMRCDEVKISVSILLSSFQNSEEYLAEIYNRIRNEEKVFAVRKIEDEVKYGKVSMSENKLFFHSLSLSEVPKDSSLIWFDELKECAKSENFYAFINICCNDKNVSRNLIIKMYNNEKSQSFLKFCTGESGPSYKGASFKKGEDKEFFSILLEVSDTIENGCPSRRLIDYNVCDGEGTFHCKKGYSYLYVYNERIGFEIFFTRKDYSVIDHVVGRVLFPTDLKDCINYEHSSFLKIFDSGIILEV